MTNTNQRTNWKRFSLRTLFVLMTLCCMLFGTWAAYVNPYRLQQRSLAVVNNLQGNTGKAPAEGAGWQRWLVTTLLGDDAFQQVTEVDLNGKKIDDETLRSLAGLIYLRKLSLDYTAVTDDSIATLRSMPKLQSISLRYTNVSDRGAEQLATLPELRSAYLTGTKITDAAVPNLAKLGSLEELYIRWTGITNDGADSLATALPRCDVYHHALVTP
ncbi:MAG: hypothetical protein L0228_04695 [Planctomycetes bacterium]|nr:hypothetical protein [Planctomycetota bacterium]